MQTIHMNCQAFFSLKSTEKEKKIKILFAVFFLACKMLILTPNLEVCPRKVLGSLYICVCKGTNPSQHFT